jgi:hypothetical protein
MCVCQKNTIGDNDWCHSPHPQLLPLSHTNVVYSTVALLDVSFEQDDSLSRQIRIIWIFDELDTDKGINILQENHKLDDIMS